MLSIHDILNYLEARHFDFEYKGRDDVEINGFSSLFSYCSGDITWIKEQTIADTSNCECIRLAVVQRGVHVDTPNAIYSSQSKKVFFSILDYFFEEKEEISPIGQGTYISPKAVIGKKVIIGHNCTIDGDIIIGDGTRIYNNVTIINKARIGQNCVIQSGAVLGHDGFGYTEDGDHRKTMVKHYGGIQIGDNVYIGANTCIERGTIDNTVIKDGTKIDMLCLIGHNSTLEENSALVGGTMILGSVKIEKNGYVASALVKNQCRIGENALVGLGSVVISDVQDNSVVIGVPAKDYKK